MAEKKKTERKTERRSHWAKGFGADAFVFWLLFAVFGRENGTGRGFASCWGKSRGEGVCAVRVLLVLLGDVWGERRCWSTEDGKTEKTATSATARERVFTTKRGYGMLFSCILLFYLFGGLTAA